nr:MAG TPA: GET complex subunit GET2 [Caudoviricetes sp.]
MSDKPTYMDCWHFIAPLIPVTDDKTSQWVYVMTFHALNEAEKRRVEKEKRKKCEKK